MKLPILSHAMTPFPQVVETHELLSEARARMRASDLRHLPVTDDGELTGVVTDRDIGLVENATRDTAKRETLTVRDVGVIDAYVVELSEPLDRVLAEMADHHIDSALVVKRGKLAGIFTSSDACNQFRLFLQMIFDRGGDDVA